MSDAKSADAAFAASLAAAIAMEPATTDEAVEPDGVVGETEPDAEPITDDESDGEGADEAEDGADDAAPSGESAAKELLLAGDKAGALKALGLDPKILDLNDAKFRTMRQGLKAADEKVAEATRLHAEAVAAQAETKRLYEKGQKELGPVLQMRRLLAKGDYASAKDLLESLAPPGTTYRQIAEGIAAAASGMSAAEQLYRRKLRELDEQEQKKAEPEKKPAPAGDTNKNLEGAKKMLSSTDLKDIPGAAEALVRVAAENWDAEKKGFKVPKAKLVELVRQDTVIAQLLELRALKAAKGKKAPEPEPEAEEDEEKPRDKTGRFRERPRRPPAPKLTPQQEKEAAAERRFQASLAAAREMEKSAQRKTGKGRR